MKRRREDTAPRQQKRVKVFINSIHFFVTFINTIHFIQLLETPWVPELNLSMNDKAVVESPDGMLTDKHMDEVRTLLASQYTHLMGLQSSLLCQREDGFIPIAASGGFMPEG